MPFLRLVEALVFPVGHVLHEPELERLAVSYHGP
jgi:hypothetical protein